MAGYFKKTGADSVHLASSSRAASYSTLLSCPTRAGSSGHSRASLLGANHKSSTESLVLGGTGDHSHSRPCAESIWTEAVQSRDTMVEKLNEYRKSGLLCDVMLDCAGENFIAHRVVLASSSTYFESLFLNEGNHDGDKCMVSIQCCNAECFQLILSYMYGTSIRVSLENVEPLLLVCDEFGLAEIKATCLKFMGTLAEHITTSIWSRLWELAEAFDVSKLHWALDRFLVTNINEVLKEDGLLDLDYDMIRKICSDDRLVNVQEKDLYDFYVKWLKADIRSRECHLVELMDSVRFSLIVPECIITRVEKEELMRDPVCQEMIKEAMKHLIAPQLSDKNNPKFRPRLKRTQPLGPLEAQEYLLCICMSEAHTECYVWWYNITAYRWYQGARLRIPREVPTITVITTTVYCAGGIINGKSSNVVESYSTLCNEWRVCKPMCKERVGHAMVAIRGFLYALGGTGDCTMERCTPGSTGSWTDVTSPPEELEISPYARYLIFTTKDRYINVYNGRETSESAGDTPPPTGRLAMYDTNVDQWTKFRYTDALFRCPYVAFLDQLDIWFATIDSETIRGPTNILLDPSSVPAKVRESGMVASVTNKGDVFCYCEAAGLWKCCYRGPAPYERQGTQVWEKVKCPVPIQYPPCMVTCVSTLPPGQ